MGGSNKNFPGVNRPSNIQGVGKNRKNRRALSAINQNIIRYPTYHCVVHKRCVLTEKNVAENKNPNISAHCHVTRMFAAQLAGKDHHPSEEIKPSIQPNVSIHQSKDYNIIDAEDQKPVDDNVVPMFVQHTEAMLEEIYEMDAEVEVEMEDIDEEMMVDIDSCDKKNSLAVTEYNGDIYAFYKKSEDADVEMEDIDEETVDDIDSCDKKNPLAVTEYIGDLYAFYKKSEILSCVPSNYMDNQFDINGRMRAILIDWLIEVHYNFELVEETLYLTVNLIDRFLALQSVVRKKLQVVGVTAMLLASKYEEVSVPAMEDLILICDGAYCCKEVLDMEKLMLNTLQFNLSVPTPYVFMRRFLKAAQSDKTLELLSFFIVELCLVESEMLKFPPSLLAAAAIYTAHCTLNGFRQWNKTLEKHTSYKEYELQECARLMVTFHKNAGMGKLNGVHKKYSTSKYGYAAKNKPAIFLIDAEEF